MFDLPLFLALWWREGGMMPPLTVDPAWDEAVPWFFQSTNDDHQNTIPPQKTPWSE